MCLQIMYIYLIYMYKDDLSLNKNWYAIKPNPTKQNYISARSSSKYFYLFHHMWKE